MADTTEATDMMMRISSIDDHELDEHKLSRHIYRARVIVMKFSGILQVYVHYQYWGGFAPPMEVPEPPQVLPGGGGRTSLGMQVGV